MPLQEYFFVIKFYNKAGVHFAYVAIGTFNVDGAVAGMVGVGASGFTGRGRLACFAVRFGNITRLMLARVFEGNEVASGFAFFIERYKSDAEPFTGIHFFIHFRVLNHYAKMYYAERWLKDRFCLNIVDEYFFGFCFGIN